jgi:DNA-binding transcriptional MocR family regulator
MEQCSQRYKIKRDTMAEALKRYFPSTVKYELPAQGIFTWVTLPDNINSSQLLNLSMKKQGTTFLPSAAFCISDKKATSGMRLNFSSISTENIVRGIQQLGTLILRY